jgi:hypothetical protein
MKIRKRFIYIYFFFFNFLIFFSASYRVVEVEQTRSDGNIIKVTEYDLTKEKFNPIISDAVRTHSEKVPHLHSSKHSHRQSRVESRVRSPSSPIPER